MPTGGQHESLDEIVSHSAVVLADQIQKAAAWAKSEMDLQIEVAGALKEFARRAKITLEVHHNVTVATGRPDSVYSNVIVEYKDPGSLSGNRDAANNKKLIEQIRQRFYDMRREENRSMNSMFGVGTDGKYFVFVRFRDDKWTDQEPLEVNRYSTERFLWALYNLGQKGKPYQPEYLHGDFGSDSLIAQEGVRTLYDEILKTENPKAQVFFNQWKILFGEVCGYDVENLSDKLKKLAEFYGVKGKPHPGQLLFALHTYYALLIKLLAAEIVSFFNPWMTRQVEKLQNATTSAKLRRELEELERGGIFHTMGITNFLEGDLFAWYLPVWSEPIEKLARQMVQKLDDYNPGTFSEDPAQSRDLLKKLYQQLFPKSVRHDLGEYYTPDWLADHVLNELGYEGNPDKRLLDPACGSGTFLVMAINRIRRWYDANREKCAYDEGDLLKKILANVIGFDLNPLAVMAARTNYLVAIKDLIRHSGHIEIPVYLCDSIITPAEYGDLFTGAGNVAKVPCSAMKPPHLLVPKEIAKSPKEVATYAETLEKCIKNGYSPSEFITRCHDEGLAVTITGAHSDLYKELVRLDKENKNGIWARIIKNNFAPLFAGVFDYVAGNPPWINWRNLPADYRDAIGPLWQDYGLFDQKGLDARLGGGMDDISVLMLFVAADHFLKESGRLGFVITQTIFKSAGGGRGFRRLRLKKSFLQVTRVSDFSACQPFEGAANRTAVIALSIGKLPNLFPVSYRVFLPTVNRPPAEMSTSEAEKFFKISDLQAFPLAEESGASWITLEPGMYDVFEKIHGATDYRARIGAHSGGAAGVFWVDVLERTNKGVLIRNLFDAGRNKFPQVSEIVEPEFVKPLLRGKDVERWKCFSRHHIVLPYLATNGGKAVSESVLRRQFPKTFEYFGIFKDRLIDRPHYRQHFEPSGQPYWSLYNVGDYTFAPHRIVWREQSADFKCCVVPKAPDSTYVADAKLIVVTCALNDEAYFLAACLNSSPARFLIQSYTISVQVSTHVLSHVRVPPYDGSPLHDELASKSRKCHAAAAENESDILESLENEIDDLAAQLWKLSRKETNVIKKSLTTMFGKKRNRTSEVMPAGASGQDKA
jgi:N-6 DNA Methylase